MIHLLCSKSLPELANRSECSKWQMPKAILDKILRKITNGKAKTDAANEDACEKANFNL